MKRCVIIGGADINNYEYIKKSLGEKDFYVCCDSGLKHREGLGIKADLIVGDFDSFENPNIDTETIVLPCAKDDTDVFFAIKTAIARGFDDFLLLGVIGGRFDHSMVNISALLYLDNAEKTAKIIDDYSEMELVQKEAFIEEKYPFFSLMALSENVTGINITNAKFPLENGTINIGYQYGISNEVLKGKLAKVEVKEGKLLLIKVI